MGHLSLRSKFLLLLGLVLATATAAYLGIAIQLFNKDKQAYIYDNNAALADSLGEQVATGLLSALKTMRQAAQVAAANAAAGRDAAVATVLAEDDGVAALTVYKVEGDALVALVRRTNEAYLAAYELDHAYTDALAAQVLPSVKELTKVNVVFQTALLGAGPPLLAAALAVRAEGQAAPGLVVLAFLRQDHLVTLLARSATYNASVVDAAGAVLVHPDLAVVRERRSLAANLGVRQALRSAAPSGALEYTDEHGVERLLSYKKLGLGGLTLLSEITKDKAYFAARKLIERSVLLAILVLALALIPSVVYSRRLTAALQRLAVATQRLAGGDFSLEVAVTSRDEVGALSASFNHMAREIGRLLRATAANARMEKELETAQLVQDNFFPRADIRVGPYAVAACFKPATECGGDWWGSIRQGDELILLIGDATGHGVPAALITAAAHSCASTLARLAEKIAGVALSPAFIMDSLNAAIFRAGRGRVQMTFFVASANTATGRVRYVNASHELPVLLRDPGADAPATRDHLDTLGAGRPDACLGESLATVFHEHEGALGPGDALLLYTDGLVECRNAAREEFGERRLLRSLLATAEGGAAAVKDGLVDAALAFCGAPAPEDDLTLVVLKRDRAAVPMQKAG